MNYFHSCLVLVLFFTLTKCQNITSGNDTHNCREIAGSVYNACGPACPPTCSDQHPKLDPKCQKPCVPGCFCQNEMILLTVVGGENMCIPKEKCPIKKCPVNEQWYSCPPCEGTCNDPHPVCTKMCEFSKCACKLNHVRDFTNRCIPIQACRRCPANKQLYPCYTLDPTCTDSKRTGPTVCDLESGICGCKPGYVLLDERSQTCVHKQQCPKCPANMELYNCPYCNPTCGNPTPLGCPELCKEGQCICSCKLGYVISYDPDGLSGCIPLSECPKCRDDQKYYDCVCDSTCKKPGICLINCDKPGCGCRPDLVIDDDTGRCIPPGQCRP